MVIGGIEAHVCVAQTAIDLEGQGFEAFVVADAVVAREDEPQACLPVWLKAGVDIVDSEMVLFEWLEQSRHAGIQGTSSAGEVAADFARAS